MTDLTTHHRNWFFRAVWDEETEAWTCDCRLFRLRIEVEREAPCGVVCSYQHKAGHDWSFHEAATVRQALIAEAKDAAGTDATLKPTMTQP